MAKSVQLQVEANANPAIAAFQAMENTARGVEQTLRGLGKGGKDAGQQIQDAVSAGGDRYAQLKAAAEAAGMSQAQVAAQLRNLAREDRLVAKERLKEISDTERALRAQEKAQRDSAKASLEAMVAAKAQAEALQGLSQGSLGLAKSLLDTSSNFEQQRAKLLGLYHDTDTAKAKFAEFVQFASTTPFEVSSVVNAAITMQALGQDASALLPIAGDLAARFGRDIPDAALALGKAMAGSQDGVQLLVDSFGVSRNKLKEYGAAVDSTGSILLRGEANLGKFRQAILNIAKTEWVGSMALQADTLQGKLSNLSDATEQLKAKMGDALAPTVRSVAENITGLVSGVTNSAPVLVEFAGEAVGASAAVLGISAAVASATVAFPLLALAVSTLTGQLALLAVGVIEVNNALLQAIKTGEELDRQTKQSSESIQALARAHRDWAGKNAEELHKLGVTSRDTAKVVQGLQEEVSLLYSQGYSMQGSRIQALIREQQAFRELGQELAEIQKLEAAAAEVEKKAREEREKSIKLAQEVAKAEQDLLQVRLDAAKLALEQSQNAGTATVSNRQAVIDAEMALELRRYDDAVQKTRDELQLKKDAGEATPPIIDAANKQIEALTAAHNLAVERFAQKRLDIIAEENRKALQFSADRLAAEGQRLQDSVSLLQLRARAGEAVDAELVAANQRLQDNLLAQERKRHEVSLADLRKAGGDAASIQAEQARHAEAISHLQAQVEIRRLQAAQQVHDAIVALSQDEALKRKEELDKQVDAFRSAGASELQIAEYIAAKKAAIAEDENKKKLSAAREISNLQQAALEDDMRALEEKAAKGQDVTSEEIANVQKRHALEREEILATRKELVQQYGSAEAADKILRERIAADQRKEKQEIQAIGKARVEYLEQYIQKLEEIMGKNKEAFGGSPYGIEEFFKRQSISQLGNTEEQQQALQQMGLSANTNIGAMLDALKASKMQAAQAASQAGTSGAAAGTVNIYLDGRQGGSEISSSSKSSLSNAMDNVLRDLRFGR